MYDSDKIMVLCSLFASLISFKSCVVFMIEYINEEENWCENKLSNSVSVAGGGLRYEVLTGGCDCTLVF
jgi:hypothetical protein